MLHMKDQTLLLNTHRCVPIVLDKFQNSSLMYIGLEPLFLSCMNFYITIFLLLSENLMQDASQLDYHFLQPL